MEGEVLWTELPTAEFLDEVKSAAILSTDGHNNIAAALAALETLARRNGMDGVVGVRAVPYGVAWGASNAEDKWAAYGTGILFEDK